MEVPKSVGTRFSIYAWRQRMVVYYFPTLLCTSILVLLYMYIHVHNVCLLISYIPAQFLFHIYLHSACFIYTCTVFVSYKPVQSLECMCMYVVLCILSHLCRPLSILSLPLPPHFLPSSPSLFHPIFFLLSFLPLPFLSLPPSLSFLLILRASRASLKSRCSGEGEEQVWLDAT